jgi:Flp pilus assembly pilin Flp
MKEQFKRFVRGEEAQDLIEYALLAAFVSLAAITGLNALSGGLNTFYGNLGETIENAPIGGTPPVNP